LSRQKLTSETGHAISLRKGQRDNAIQRGPKRASSDHQETSNSKVERGDIYGLLNEAGVYSSSQGTFYKEWRDDPEDWVEHQLHSYNLRDHLAIADLKLPGVERALKALKTQISKMNPAPPIGPAVYPSHLVPT
jgi:hypothetical protein